MNSVVRMPQNMPDQQGNWFWDGTQWVCGPCNNIPPFPCPPPGFPPPGCPPWFAHGVNSPPWYPGANAGVSFGTTAPPNPVRGHFWWNGFLLALFDGAVWVDTATGQIVPPTVGGGPSPAPGGRTTTEMFQIFQNGGPTFTPGVWTTLPWNVNPGTLAGTWDAILHKYTPNRAGFYLSSFFSNYNLTGAGASGRLVQQNDDGSTTNRTFSISEVNVPAAQGGWMSATDIVYMNGVTDYVRLWVFDSIGNASVVETSWTMTLLP